MTGKRLSRHHGAYVSFVPHNHLLLLLICSIILPMEEDTLKEVAKQLGARGGKTTASKYGSEYYRILQKKSTQSKLKAKKKLKNTDSFGA
jgi:hypothetical protein